MLVISVSYLDLDETIKKVKYSNDKSVGSVNPGHHENRLCIGSS